MTDSQTPQTDVIVIGAGLSGLTAARAVAKAGKSVIVLEGRNRVGGRVYSRRLSGREEVFNVGANSFAPEWHLNMAEEIKRYGLLVTDETYAVDTWTAVLQGRRFHGNISKFRIKMVLWLSRQRWISPLAGFYPFMPLGLRFFMGVPLSQGRKVVPLMRFLLGLSRKVGRATGFDDPLLKEYDVPFAQSIEHLKLGPDVRDFVLGCVAHILSGTPDSSISLLNVLHLISRLNCNPLAFFAWDRSFVGGNSALPNAIARDIPDLHLDSPVAEVQQNAIGVTVTLRDGTTYEASRCILAVPFAAMSMIQFDPPLNESKREISRPAFFAAKRAIAIVNHFDESCIGLDYGIDSPFSYAVGEKYSDHTHLVDLVAVYDQIDFNDMPSVERAMQPYFPGVKLLSIDYPDWQDQEFSRQTWNVIYTPGQLTRHWSGAARAEGRLHFCNSDLATGWIGWQDGALEAGKRAGAECLAAL